MLGSSTQESGKYRKSLGLFELISLGVGGTVGSGIFVVPGLAAGLAGSTSLLAWLVVAVSATTTMLCLSWVITRFPSTGAFYTVFFTAFGKRIALSLVILYLIGTVFGIATIAAGIGQYLQFLNIQGYFSIEIAIIVVLCLINIRGIFHSGMTENVLTTLKILPLIFIAVVLVPFIKITNIFPLIPVTPTDFLRVVILVYWPFTGFEISAIPAEEVKDQKFISRALTMVMALVVALYILLNVSLIGSQGSVNLAASEAPIATAAESLFGPAGPLIALVGIIAMVSALNAYIVGGSRVLQNLSIQLHLPIIGDLTKWGTPARSLGACALTSILLLVFSNRFSELASISVITTLVPYIFISIASLILFKAAKIKVISILSCVITGGILFFSFIF